MDFRIAGRWLIRTGCYQNHIAWRYFSRIVIFAGRLEQAATIHAKERKASF